MTTTGKLIAEADSAGSTQKEYVWYGMLPIAQIKYGTNAGTYYYHSDQLNTPQLMTNSTQAVVWKADYEPFGEVNIVTNTIENNLRFPGQYYDSETGNHYNYFRDYNPDKGRYLESDPIGLRGGVNTYTYVNSDPLGNKDPLGLAATTVPNLLDWILDPDTIPDPNPNPSHPDPAFPDNPNERGCKIECAQTFNDGIKTCSEKCPLPNVAATPLCKEVWYHWLVSCTLSCAGV